MKEAALHETAGTVLTYLRTPPLVECKNMVSLCLTAWTCQRQKDILNIGLAKKVDTTAMIREAVGLSRCISGSCV